MTISAQTLFTVMAASQAVAVARAGAFHRVMSMVPATRITDKWQVAASR